MRDDNLKVAVEAGNFQLPIILILNIKKYNKSIILECKLTKAEKLCFA